jgi:hypothetical protein
MISFKPKLLQLVYVLHTLFLLFNLLIFKRVLMNNIHMTAPIAVTFLLKLL